MNLDILTNLSAAQVIGNTTANSTNAYDAADSQGLLTGIGESCEVVITVAAATMNSSTCLVTLYADDDNNGTNKTTIGTVTMPSATIAGDKFVIDIPANDDANSGQMTLTNRYYYLTIVNSGTSVTINAWIQPSSMVQNNNIYPKSGYIVK